MKYLWVDQYDHNFWAEGRKDLKAQIPGRVSILYWDTKDGKTKRIGYVIGQHWLTQYQPVEKDV